MKKLVPDPPPADPALTLLECRIAHALELLRCASAAVHKSADALQGPPRHLAMAGMHLMTQAHLELDKVLDQWPLMQPDARNQEALPASS